MGSGDCGSCVVFLSTEAQSFESLLREQPTLLRLLPHLGLSTEASMDFLCLSGVILAFVAMVSRVQRNSLVFAALWMFYFSLFQVKMCERSTMSASASCAANLWSQ